MALNIYFFPIILTNSASIFFKFLLKFFYPHPFNYGLRFRRNSGGNAYFWENNENKRRYNNIITYRHYVSLIIRCYIIILSSLHRSIVIAITSSMRVCNITLNLLRNVTSILHHLYYKTLRKSHYLMVHHFTLSIRYFIITSLLFHDRIT